jgi:predicted permease
MSTQALGSFRLPLPIPLDVPFALDAKVMTYTFLLAVATAFFFGFTPAWLATRTQLSGALKGEDIGGARWRRFGLRNILVVAQVTLSLILLVATGLFLRSLQKANSIDVGFRTGRLLMMSVDPRLQGYSPARTAQFLNQAAERVRALPGVRSAAWTDIVPLSIGGTSHGFDVEGEPKKEGRARTSDVRTVSDTYFETMGVPLSRGRIFSAASDAHSILVNEELVRKQFPNGDPLGRRLRFEDTSWEIVGVVKNAKSRTLGEEQRQEIYRPFRHDASAEGAFFGQTLLIQSESNPAALGASVRREIAALDANLVVFDQRTMEEHLRNALFLPRLAATLFGVFGAAGLLLAAVGIYGVMSYSVSRRTREIGIRMAVGSTSYSVQGMVLRQGLTLAAIAIAAGLGISVAAARLAAAILYGVQPLDPVTFAVVPLFLAAVVLLATLLPSRRAARIDPIRALRYE